MAVRSAAGEMESMGIDTHDRPSGAGWATAFFVLLALTPNIPYVEVGGAGLTFNDVPPILAIICGSLAVASRRRRGEKLRMPALALCTGGIAVIAGASALAHGLRLDDVLGGPVRWIEVTIIIGLAFALGSDQRLLSLFLQVAVIAAAADALFGLAAFVTGYFGPNFIGIQAFRSYQALYGIFPGRITGTLGLPSNAAGVLFALTLPVAVAYFLSAIDRVKRLRWAVVATVLALALLFTFSRVPIAIGLAMVVLLLAIRLSPAVGLSSMAFFSLVILATPLRDRFLVDQNNRFSLWTSAINMIRDNPLLGVGPDSYVGALPEYAVTRFGVATTTAHNSLLEAAATMGIFAGLLLALAMVTSLAWLPVSLRLRRSRPELLGAWLGMFGFVVGSVTVNNFFWPQLALLYWAMAAVLLRATALPDAASGLVFRRASGRMSQRYGLWRR